MISVRDYSTSGTGSEIHPYGVRRVEDGRYLLFQVWDWDGPHYNLSFYFMHEEPEKPVQAQVFRSRYYAIPVKRLLELMAIAGFKRVKRLDNTFYQPLLAATRGQPA